MGFASSINWADGQDKLRGNGEMPGRDLVSEGKLVHAVIKALADVGQGN